jgi:hypothetical protein
MTHTPTRWTDTRPVRFAGPSPRETTRVRRMTGNKIESCPEYDDDDAVAPNHEMI